MNSCRNSVTTLLTTKNEYKLRISFSEGYILRLAVTLRGTEFDLGLQREFSAALIIGM